MKQTSTPNTTTYWNSVIAPIAAKVPVVTSELGSTMASPANVNAVNSYMSWADTNGVSYLAWAWGTSYEYGALGILASWSGPTPSTYGQAFCTHFVQFPGATNYNGSTLTLAPPIQTGEPSSPALQATLVNSCNQPLSNTTVTFTVLSGPNASLTGSATTNSNGIASFTYTSAAPGTDTVQASVTGPAGTIYSNSVTVTTTAPATPVITWATPADVTYGTALSSTQLDATANVPGTFIYSPAAGTVLNAGPNQQLDVTFTPTDTTDYTTASASASINVLQAPLHVIADNQAMTYSGTLPSPTYHLQTADFVNGDTASVVSGAASCSITAGPYTVAGSPYAITCSQGTLVANNYTFVFVAGALTVNPAHAALSWATPGPVSYGTALDGTQLDATANVAGTFAYSPPAGTLVAVGNQTLTATFTPTDSSDYISGDQIQVTLQVNQTTPTITWSNPAAITYGTALSSSQLDATANVPGTFVYTPTAGTVLNAGSGQTLNVTFTPTDTTDYTTASGNTYLNVLQANQAISFGALSNKYVASAPFTLSATASSGLPVSFSTSGQCTVSANTVRIVGAGVCTITASQGGNSNYSAAPSVSQSFTISLAQGILYVLDTSAKQALFSYSGCVQAAGNVYVNSSASYAISQTGSGCSNGHAFNATSGGSINEVGGYSASCCSPTPVHMASAVADPLGGVALPSYSNGSWHAAGSSAPLPARTVSGSTLSPGVYASGINLSSGSYTLQPGIYVMDNSVFKISGSASISGTGVFIYNSNHSTPGSCQAITLSGSGTISLSAMTSGSYADILFAQNRSCATQSSFSVTSKTTLHGGLYLADANLVLTGPSSSQITWKSPLFARTVSVTNYANISLLQP